VFAPQYLQGRGFNAIFAAAIKWLVHRCVADACHQHHKELCQAESFCYICCGGWLQIIWEQLKWLPTTIIFFNSVLFHMTEVCAIYFLGLPVVWGATSKVGLQAENNGVSCAQGVLACTGGRIDIGVHQVDVGRRCALESCWPLCVAETEAGDKRYPPHNAGMKHIRRPAAMSVTPSLL
jgi:hypothetical protein